MRRTPIHKALVFGAGALFASACDQSFNPYDNRSDVPIVYSFLATDRSIQYLRIYKSIDQSTETTPPDGGELPITAAQVMISDGVSTYTFKDTLLERTDTTRYRSPIHVYLCPSFIPLRGTTYNLTVDAAPYMQVFGSVTVPWRSFPGFSSTKFLDDPGLYPDDEKIVVSAGMEAQPSAAILRLLVEYEVFENSAFVTFWDEVPIVFLTKEPNLEEALYGSVKKLETNVIIGVYSNLAYRTLMSGIASKTYPKPLRYRKIIIQVVQLEENLYNYYSVVRGFEDPFSIRLDKPNYSNIMNGSGLFGAYTVDTVSHTLPTNFVGNRP